MPEGFRFSRRLLNASMGPQLVSCGCECQQPLPTGTLEASMGPQLVSCGCIEFGVQENAVFRLQWGRSS